MDLGLNNQEHQQEPPSLPNDALAEPFLANISDEQERFIVGKYVKDWDAKVTGKFQEIHDSYAPYKALGTPEELTGTIQFLNEINEDPLEFYNNLRDYLIKEGQIVPEELNKAIEDEGGKSEIELLKEELATLRGTVESDVQSRQEAENQKQLDNYLKDMHNAYGEFDDDYIVAKLAKGIKIEDAIKDFNDRFERKVTVQKNERPGAKIITGGAGSHPQDQERKPFKNASERKQFVMEALATANADD